MKPFFTLLKLNFNQLLLTSFNLGGKTNKEKTASGIIAFSLICLLMLFLSFTFSFMLGIAFAMGGGLDVMLMYMVMMAIFSPIVFTFTSAQNIIFGTKDMDLVLSLPISSFKVMLARILAFYLQCLVFTEALMVPPGIIYAIMGGENGFYVSFVLILLGFFLALIPTLFGLVAGFLVSLAVSKTRFKNLINTLVNIVLLLLYCAGIFYFSIISGNFSGGGKLFDVTELRNNMFWPFRWLIDKIISGNIFAPIIFAIVCIIPFLLICWLFSHNFVNLLSGLSSTAFKGNYKMGQLKTKSAFSALLGKEARKFLGTPILLINSGFSLFMGVVLAILAIVFKSSITNFLTILPPFALNLAAPIVLLVVIFLIGMTLVSSSSISLEGKTLWILKESPISTWEIFMAKAGFNLILDISLCILTIPALCFAFNFSFGTFMLLFIIGAFYSIFASFLGLFVNLLFPRMDAENDALIVKQSASVIVTMLLDSAATLILVAVYFLVSLYTKNFLVPAFIMCLVIISFIALILKLLDTVGQKAFSAL